MNRRERKQTEKKLGLNKFYKSLPRKEKFNLMAENIKAGKKKEEELKENVRIYTQEVEEDIESKEIFTLAESIAKQKKIPVIDAINEAKERYIK
jgi:hypothetical protein